MYSLGALTDRYNRNRKQKIDCAGALRSYRKRARNTVIMVQINYIIDFKITLIFGIEI